MKNWILNENEELILKALISERYSELKNKETTRDEIIFNQIKELNNRFNNQE